MAAKKEFKTGIIDELIETQDEDNGADEAAREDTTAKTTRTSKAAKGKAGATVEGHRAQGYKKLDIEQHETRSRHVQLLLKPSLYREVKAAAKANRISVNKFVEYALTDFLKTIKAE